ncbi:Transcriptional regulator, LuxR family protein [Labilithrix luteola]|uniref:Transcriptional regulator, LuxR family protein n=1 Tax=Labilithrix luteola TaxID=1391654 RepID=A0A0K1Q6D0_9BACT|nr:Transcriptional regulator, LuxR family protein [Labilithrix luteola]
MLNEVRELGQTTEAARAHLVESLLVVVGAVIGTCVLDVDYRPGAKNSLTKVTLAGFDDTSIALFQAHQSHGACVNPYHVQQINRLSAKPCEVFAATDCDLLTKRDWYSSPWVSDVARPARFDHFVATVRPLDGNHRVEGLSFMRAAADRPFSEEDRDVLHLVHLECAGLYVEQRMGISLAPRVEATLEHLLTGATDKEIAVRLRLSPHTVRQYVKTIFQAYGVSSRAELIARSLRGRTATRQRLA